MEAGFTILGILCFLGVLFLILAGIAILVIVLARDLGRKTDRNWQQIADHLGLTYGRDEVKNAVITGRLHGVDVRASTSRTTQFTMGGHRRPMIWTNVVATPAVKPRFEVWLRRNNVQERPGLTERTTGDMDFDERYTLFIADGADVDTGCPAKVRNAMLETARQVQIADQSVIWSNGFLEQNLTRLSEALESCAQVAKAIEDHARDTATAD